MKIVTLFILLFSLFGSAQNSADLKLEKLIDNDQFELAKLYLQKKTSPYNKNNPDDYIYYNAKAGFVYLRLGILDSAMYYSKNASQKLAFTSKKEQQYESWKSIAYCFTKYGQLDSATVYTRKLFDAVDATKNYEMQRYANVLMGMISFQNNLLDDSLKYYEQALALSKKANKTTNYKVDYYNLGLTSTILKNYQGGIDYLTLAETYALKGNDKRLLARIYGTTADNYFKQENDTKRAFFLEKANTIAKSINDSKLLAMGASHQMKWDIAKGKTDKAYKEGATLQKNLENQDLPQLKAADDSLMYAMAKKRNQTDAALYYLESFTENRLKLLRQNGRRQIEEVKVKYELKNKNLTIEKQQIEIIASKRISKIKSLVLIIVAIILCFVLYVYFKNKKIVGLLYYKEKEKDTQIKKLLERVMSKNNSFEILKDNSLNDINADNRAEDITNSEYKTKCLFEKIMKVIEKDQFFLKPDFDQNDLLNILGTNKKYIYEAISQHSDLNFRGIVNRLRINESKTVIKNKILNRQEINFSTVFAESGFNSNSSFYRTFKTLTGITPHDYAIEFKKDLNTPVKTMLQ